MFVISVLESTYRMGRGVLLVLLGLYPQARTEHIVGAQEGSVEGIATRLMEEASCCLHRQTRNVIGC